MHMHIAISPRQWQPWTAVSVLLGLISMVGAEHPFKRQPHTTHVGAGGWELHGSSPTTYARKVDQQRKRQMQRQS